MLFQGYMTEKLITVLHSSDWKQLSCLPRIIWMISFRCFKTYFYTCTQNIVCKVVYNLKDVPKIAYFLDSPPTCKLRMRKNLIFCSQNFRNNGDVKCGNKTELQQQQNKKILQKCHKNQQSIQAISMAPASFALCQLACYISISIFKSHLSPNPKVYIGVRISVANQKFCF